MGKLDKDAERQMQLRSLADNLLPKHVGAPTSSPKWERVALAGLAAFVVVIGLLVFQQKPMVNIGRDQIINVHNASGKALVPWSSLPLESRNKIKAEARQHFPEIDDIGKGVDWKPVAQWLAEEKGVAVSNARDLFR